MVATCTYLFLKSSIVIVSLQSSRTVALPSITCMICDSSSPEVCRWCTIVLVEFVSLDIATNSDLESDRVTDRCGTAKLGGQVCPR